MYCCTTRDFVHDFEKLYLQIVTLNMILNLNNVIQKAKVELVIFITKTPH